MQRKLLELQLGLQVMWNISQVSLYAKPCHKNLHEFTVTGVCYLICEDCSAAIEHELLIALVYWEPKGPTGFNSKDRAQGLHFLGIMYIHRITSGLWCVTPQYQHGPVNVPVPTGLSDALLVAATSCILAAQHCWRVLGLCNTIVNLAVEYLKILYNNITIYSTWGYEVPTL